MRIVARIGFAVNGHCADADSIAIVDTGAPLTLLPEPMWRHIDRKILGTVFVGGVSDKATSKFRADLAEVTCIISDDNAKLGPYHIHALLAHNDNVPALLGVSGVLERSNLAIQLHGDTAFIETP